ncbi:uncharacterized protein BDZ99DRAFT_525965 [Mytilinidion resinicola]|uniref:Uncharacterized protein n=1 Tax=Mytilinidion resinicola TaxID=574789 RepID=A0A6A6Y6U4_9PEZI|nr:uncharacterized protein BDZ99DRAFT_525965 [Mytilinidion resinicola]KAF2803915.1 hypothetical protein BDZ99DRAFT_525965 [Mytilinidion resinicola]
MLPHIAPIAISLGVIQLSIRQTYWKDLTAISDDARSQLASLQVAAKAHEVLVIFSLTTVLFHHIKHQLSSPHGITFGVLTSGYLVGTGGYLIQRDFWNSLHSAKHGLPWRNCWRKTWLIIFMLIATSVAIIP